VAGQNLVRIYSCFNKNFFVRRKKIISEGLNSILKYPTFSQNSPALPKNFDQIIKQWRIFDAINF
jgi:hypothetical protein